MKKLIALLLCLVLAASLCACKNTKSDNEGSNAENNGAEQQGGTAAEENTEPVDITTLDNYYQDLSEPVVIPDKMNYQLFQAWRDEDLLVLQIYFINGHTGPVTEVWFEEFSVFNEDVEVDGELVQGGLNASANIGPVEIEKPIEPGTYELVKLYIPADVEADLSKLSLQITDSYIWD